MSASAQPADPGSASWPSEKSNAWNYSDRDDIFHRRQLGEKWETICLVRISIVLSLVDAIPRCFLLLNLFANCNRPPGLSK